MKRLLFLVLVFFLVLNSCEKDEPYIYSSDRYIGDYCGDKNDDGGGWSNAYFSIIKSGSSNSEIIFDNITRHGNIPLKATVTANQCLIPEQSFPVEYHSAGGSYTKYTAIFNGKAKLSLNDAKIEINLLEQQYYSPSHIDSVRWIITACNSSKLNPIGSYSGTEGTAIISASGDSLKVTLTYNYNGENHKWKNVQSSKISGCYLYMPKQEIIDQVTGLTDSIEVSGRARGNKINFYIEKAASPYPITYSFEVEK